MNNLMYVLTIAWYLGMLYFSFSMLNALAMKLEENHPGLIDTRWKRILWVLSSFLLIPLLVLVDSPFFIFEEIRWFISTGRKGNK